MSDDAPDSLIPYDDIVQEALRAVVGRVLGEVMVSGLPGDHHFYITFKTRAAGVAIPVHLMERFPDEMTIVMQHKYWDLKVGEDYFEVGLSFSQVPAHLHIPFSAITAFVDPAVDFALQFHVDAESGPEPHEQAENDGPHVEQEDGSNVVTVDFGRKKWTGETRSESDSFGPIDVPAEAYWGAQTQRSIENFPFPDHERMPLGIIYGLAHVKRAAALAHKTSGAMPAEVADAIVEAANAILAGKHDDQFPLTIWQTGSGTQSNMNVNEVIAGIANEALIGTRGGKAPVHPNDHVNMGQSSNDSFPTAMHIAVALATHRQLLPALQQLTDALAQKAHSWGDIVKIGRTHLQDATPLTLGQEFSAYVAQLIAAKNRIEGAVLHNVQKLAQGGTAVGTGLNAPEGFDRAIAIEVSTATSIPFVPAQNKFEALATHDGLVSFHGQLNTLAVSLTKIANDIRLLGSGPRAGIGELSLPENEPGSSIMPGKVNPTQCEMLTMVATQVIGNHQAVTVGGMQGHLELNVFKPLIGANVLRSIELLSIGMETFAKNCVEGLEPNRERIAELVDRSLMLVTALAPVIGYDNAAKIAKHAHQNGLTLKQSALVLGLVDAATFDAHVRAEDMV